MEAVSPAPLAHPAPETPVPLGAHLQVDMSDKPRRTFTLDASGPSADDPRWAQLAKELFVESQRDLHRQFGYFSNDGVSAPDRDYYDRCDERSAQTWHQFKERVDGGNTPFELCRSESLGPLAVHLRDLAYDAYSLEVNGAAGTPAEQSHTAHRLIVDNTIEPYLPHMSLRDRTALLKAYVEAVFEDWQGEGPRVPDLKAIPAEVRRVLDLLVNAVPAERTQMLQHLMTYGIDILNPAPLHAKRFLEPSCRNVEVTEPAQVEAAGSVVRRSGWAAMAISSSGMSDHLLRMVFTRNISKGAPEAAVEQWVGQLVENIGRLGAERVTEPGQGSDASDYAFLVTLIPHMPDGALETLRGRIAAEDFGEGFELATENFSADLSERDRSLRETWTTNDRRSRKARLEAIGHLAEAEQRSRRNTTESVLPTPTDPSSARALEALTEGGRLFGALLDGAQEAKRGETFEALLRAFERFIDASFSGYPSSREEHRRADAKKRNHVEHTRFAYFAYMIKEALVLDVPGNARESAPLTLLTQADRLRTKIQASYGGGALWEASHSVITGLKVLVASGLKLSSEATREAATGRLIESWKKGLKSDNWWSAREVTEVLHGLDTKQKQRFLDAMVTSLFEAPPRVYTHMTAPPEDGYDSEAGYTLRVLDEILSNHGYLSIGEERDVEVRPPRSYGALSPEVRGEFLGPILDRLLQVLNECRPQIAQGATELLGKIVHDKYLLPGAPRAEFMAKVARCVDDRERVFELFRKAEYIPEEVMGDLVENLCDPAMDIRMAAYARFRQNLSTLSQGGLYDTLSRIAGKLAGVATSGEILEGLLDMLSRGVPLIENPRERLRFVTEVAAMNETPPEWLDGVLGKKRGTPKDPMGDQITKLLAAVEGGRDSTRELRTRNVAMEERAAWKEHSLANRVEAAESDAEQRIASARAWADYEEWKASPAAGEVNERVLARREEEAAAAMQRYDSRVASGEVNPETHKEFRGRTEAVLPNEVPPQFFVVETQAPPEATAVETEAALGTPGPVETIPAETVVPRVEAQGPVETLPAQTTVAAVEAAITRPPERIMPTDPFVGLRERLPERLSAMSDAGRAALGEVNQVTQRLLAQTGPNLFVHTTLHALYDRVEQLRDEARTAKDQEWADYLHRVMTNIYTLYSRKS